MNDDDLMVVQDEELSATSNEEANMVFAQWKSDDDDIDGFVNEIMEIDEQIGSNLLDDVIFSDDPCLSPTGPLDELAFMCMEQNDHEKFFVPSLDDSSANSVSSSDNSEDNSENEELKDQYLATLKKLAESMKRSQETRRSLTLKTPKTKKYERLSEVDGVLSSVEKSSRQLQYYLEENQHIL